MRKKYAIFSLLVILTSLVEFNSVFLKCDDMTSVVSVVFDPNTKDYSNEETVIELVVKAVQQLNPGNTENPFSNLIDVGDVVVIKPNLVTLSGLKREGCTRELVIKPIIELAANAGASKVIITEGPANPNWEDEVFHESGIVGLVTELQSKYQDTIISYQNVNTDEWTWVDLGQHSAFSGKYEAHQLYTYGDIQMDQDSFYYAEDSNGYNPHGYTPGLYAISNTILNADVFINLPKLKVHMITGVTISLKNLIGITITETYNTTNQHSNKDIPHWNTNHSRRGEQKPRVDTFDNDVIWRVNADLHKIAIYTDKNGVIQDTPQRKYLSVVDGVIGMEGPYIYDSEPDPHPTGVIIAGRDPIAVDIVGSRIMGFNHSVLKSLSNFAQINDHIFGTTDPSNICVVGTSLFDDTFSDFYVPHVNYEVERTEPFNVLLRDFSAPVIKRVSVDPDPLTVGSQNMIVVKPYDVEQVAAGWLQYVLDGSGPKIVRMMKEGEGFNGYLGTLDNSTTITYAICLQDEFMNLEWSEEMTTQINIPEPENEPPRAKITSPSSSRVGEALQFSSTDSSDPDGAIVHYYWDFGDGETSESVAPSHVYVSSGNYTVILTVTDDDEASDFESKTLVIENAQEEEDESGRIPGFQVWSFTLGLVTISFILYLCKRAYHTTDNYYVPKRSEH